MTEMLSTGIELMLIGMIVVFLFLVLLILLVNFMSAIILRFFPAETVATESPISPSGNQQVTAAIAAAIKHYRSIHK